MNKFNDIILNNLNLNMQIIVCDIMIYRYKIDKQSNTSALHFSKFFQYNIKIQIFLPRYWPNEN